MSAQSLYSFVVMLIVRAAAVASCCCCSVGIAHPFILIFFACLRYFCWMLFIQVCSYPWLSCECCWFWSCCVFLRGFKCWCFQLARLTSLLRLLPSWSASLCCNTRSAVFKRFRSLWLTCQEFVLDMWSCRNCKYWLVETDLFGCLMFVTKEPMHAGVSLPLPCHCLYPHRQPDPCCFLL